MMRMLGRAMGRQYDDSWGRARGIRWFVGTEEEFLVMVVGVVLRWSVRAQIIFDP